MVKATLVNGSSSQEIIAARLKELVVTSSLTQEMIAAGKTLIEKLDQSNLIVAAALWLFLPEEQTWRFVIASSEVGTYGPKKVYKQIQTALNKVSAEQPKIPLKDITAVDSKDELISLLRTVIKTDRNIGGIRFTRNFINGALIEDAYIYRLT